MQSNNVNFKIGKLFLEAYKGAEHEHLIKASQELLCALEDLEYHGSLRERNSRQLDIHFDEAVFEKLQTMKWTCSKKPCINNIKDRGRFKADFIVEPANMDRYRIIIEIEKANKKTIWIDFIKFWMFVEAGQAESAILLCPTNYAHTHSEWNLFNEACNVKKYLKQYAGVSKEKMNLIAIIGYEQRIKQGKSYKYWNSEEFNRLKKFA